MYKLKTHRWWRPSKVIHSTGGWPRSTLYRLGWWKGYVVLHETVEREIFHGRYWFYKTALSVFLKSDPYLPTGLKK